MAETTQRECGARMPRGVGMWITGTTCIIGSALQMLSNWLPSSYTTTSRFPIECINYAGRRGTFDGDQCSSWGLVSDQASRPLIVLACGGYRCQRIEIKRRMAFRRRPAPEVPGAGLCGVVAIRSAEWFKERLLALFPMTMGACCLQLRGTSGRCYWSRYRILAAMWTAANPHGSSMK